MAVGSCGDKRHTHRDDDRPPRMPFDVQRAAVIENERFRQRDAHTFAQFAGGIGDSLFGLDFHLDAENSILFLRPQAALAKEDFARIAAIVDPHIEPTGDLAGLVVETAAFPGWESLGAMASHFRFVRDHHRRVRKIAIVTDAAFGKVAVHLASHFVAAEIKQFPAGQVEAAMRWIKAG